MSTKKATLVVANSKAVVPHLLNAIVAERCIDAIDRRGVFTIALSGGSLPKFLSSLKDSFDTKSNPRFDRWHVILADERCVPETDDDSNLKCLRENLFSAIPEIPEAQIYGIRIPVGGGGEITTTTNDAIAVDYETRVVREVLRKSDGLLDLAVLGFGPDGHTCSLFPGHPLLTEETKWVAPINDSPKPPSSRITLTFPVLNSKTRHVIFCGAGGSKKPIIEAVFAKITPTAKKKKEDDGTFFDAILVDPAPYPAAMVYPNTSSSSENGESTNTLTWITDSDAMNGIAISNL